MKISQICDKIRKSSMYHDVLTEKICVKIDMKMFFECAIYGTNMAALEMAQKLMCQFIHFRFWVDFDILKDGGTSGYGPHQ